MKKILLILAVFVAFQASAQLNSPSIMLMDNPVLLNDYNEQFLGSMENFHRPTKNYRGSGWISYQDANFITGVQSASVWPIYPDSSLLSTQGTPPFHWYVHNMGTSFDPHSRKLYDKILGYDPGYEIGINETFTIDSIEIAGFYRRRVSQTDQLIIEITHTGDANATTLQSQDEWYLNNLGLLDSTLRFATPVYDYNNNKMQTPLATITKTLDLAAYNDTLSNGLNEYTLALPSPLTIPAGEKVIATVRFVPGTAHPFGTALDSANYWSHYCVESGGQDSWPEPYTGEYATGLIAVSNDRYNVTPGAVVVSGTNYLNSTYRWNNTAGFDDPYFRFHADCPTCKPIGVDDVTKLEGVSVYPNPSNGEFNISMKDNLLNQEVTINVVDLSGKTIHNEIFTNTNGTKALELMNTASGVYLYTISSDNKVAHGKLIIE